MHRLQVAIFTITFFLSATLVFSVQPMIGKMMLPHVGGSPAGWVVAMAFFQFALLAGYGLAHLGSKLNPFSHALLTLATLALGLVSLPIIFDGSLIDNQPTITPGLVFLKLAAVCALPFVALSTIAPAMQRVFAAGSHHTASDPYYFYAASNLGSFIGLLSYPILVEPLFTLDTQSHLWMLAYFALMALGALACVSVFSDKNTKRSLGLNRRTVEEEGSLDHLAWKTRLTWLLLTAVPSSLILGVTTEITTNLASAPMIWVVPLGLYLLTHIVAFSKKQKLNITLLALLHMLAIALSLFVAIIPPKNLPTLLLVAAMYLAAFFLTALLLHTRLANSRPHTRHLTEFYFWLALGGAIGGAANAFLAPLVFNNDYEFMSVLLASLLLNPLFSQKIESRQKKVYALILLATVVVYAIKVAVTTPYGYESTVPVYMPVIYLFFMIGMLAMALQPRFLLLAGIAVFSLQTLDNMRFYKFMERNFFGISKVVDMERPYHDEKLTVRYYEHGNTIHGLQVQDPRLELTPFSYYPPGSPVESAMAVLHPEKAMVMGLGAGVLACYQRLYPDMKMSFAEIDPTVVRVAKNWFTFLDKCGYDKILVGDGRQLIEKLPPEEKYDLIIGDAFTSDTVPVHLLTVEAIQSYFDHLNKDGIVIFNISNRYVDLNSPLSSVAKKVGVHAFHFVFVVDMKKEPFSYNSDWLAMTASDETAKTLESIGWRKLEKDGPLWTDNFSNLARSLMLDSSKLRQFARECRDLREGMENYIRSRRPVQP